MDINTALRIDPESVRHEPVDLTSRFLRKDNAAFLAEVARDLRAKNGAPGADEARIDPHGIGCIGLIGEYGFVGHAARQAQSVLRLDRDPSYWSHAFLIVGPLSEDANRNRSSVRSAVVWESSLTPPREMEWFSWRSGVNPRRIADYSRSTFSATAPHCVPNMAIIGIGMTEDEHRSLLKRASNPYEDQLRYDLSALRGKWLEYLSRRSGAVNPLTEGHALSAAAYAQFAYDAAGINLTPGAHQRNAAPEHIWAASLYLQKTFQRMSPDGSPSPLRPLQVWMCVRDPLCIMAPEDAVRPGDLDALLSRETPPGRSRRGQ